jgi:hypothetical protein
VLHGDNTGLQSMNTKSITPVLLAPMLDIAWPMCRASRRRISLRASGNEWHREALEALVDHWATRWDIDISGYMMGRAYGA